MNKEVVKAMNKKEGKIDKVRKWWYANDYKVMRVVLFPIYWGTKAKEKINNYLNSKCEWSEKRANEILSYYIPRKAEWCEADNTFYFFDNGMGWTMTTNLKKIKLKDRRWWKCNSRSWGGKVREYLIKDFELEGFTKEVGDTYESQTEVCFRLNENN